MDRAARGRAGGRDRVGGRRREAPARSQPGERIDRARADHVHLRRQAGRRRSRATRSPPRCSPRAGARSVALVQVPPPARRAVRLRPVRELARAGRRAPGVRACGEPACEAAWPSSTRTPGRRSTSTCMRATDMRRRAVHAARLLLQDVHPAAPRCGRSTRRCCAASPASAVLPKQAGRARVAHRVPPPPLRRARDRRRDRRAGGRARRGRAGRRRRARRRGRRAGRRAARRGRPRARPRAGRAGPRGRRRDPRRAPALGFFDGLVPVWQGDTLHQVRARAPHRRDRHDRAAARLRRQRPARA